MPEFSVEAKFQPPQGASAVEQKLADLNAIQSQAQAAAREMAGANQLLSKEWSAAAKSAGLTASEMKGLVKAEQLSTDQVKQLASAQQEADKATKGLRQSSEETAKTLGNFASAANTAVAALGVEKIAQTAVELYNLGAANERLTEATNFLTGGQADEYLERVGAAAHGAVDGELLLADANELLSTKVIGSAEEMANLTEAAIAMGRRVGVDSATSVQTMTDALSSASPKMLEQLGLLVKQGDLTAEVNRLQKENAGLSASAAQQLALKNLFIKEGNVVLAKMGGLEDDAATQSERLAVSADNLKDSFAELAVKALEPAATNLNNIIDLAGQASDALDDHKDAVLRASDSYDEYVKAMGVTGSPMMALRTGLIVSREEFETAHSAAIAHSQGLTEDARATRDLSAATEEAIPTQEELADQQQANEEAARKYAEALRDQLSAQQANAEIAASALEQQANLGMSYAASRESGEAFLDFLNQTGNDLKEVGPEYDALRASLGLVDQGQLNVEHGLADLDALLKNNVVSLQQAADIWDLLTTKQTGAANAAILAAQAHVDLSDGMSEAEEHQMLLAAHAGDASDTITQKAPDASKAIENIGTTAEGVSKILDETKTAASQSFDGIGSSATAALNRIIPVRSAVSGLFTDWMALKNNSHIDLSVTITQSGSIPNPGGGEGHAAGGMTMGGMTLVGEKGPELVFMPPGAYVRTASETKGDLAGMGAKGGDTHLTNYGPISVFPQVANPSTKEILTAMKDEMVA